MSTGDRAGVEGLPYTGSGALVLRGSLAGSPVGLSLEKSCVPPLSLGMGEDLCMVQSKQGNRIAAVWLRSFSRIGPWGYFVEGVGPEHFQQNLSSFAG